MSNTRDCWDAALYDARHGYVADFGRDLLTLLDARPGECIVDLGCGTARLTHAIALTGARVIGIDASEAMIAEARRAYPALDLRVADARDFGLGERVDAVFSNAALHWIPEADAVAASMARALKPGGRLVMEMGGRGNLGGLVPALHTALAEATGGHVDDGWYFPSIAQYAGVLERHGLEVEQAASFHRPTPLAGDDGLRSWLGMFCAHLLDSLDATRREQVLARVEALLTPTARRESGWVLDYRRLRVVARRTG